MFLVCVGGEGWSERGRGVSYIGIRERGVKNGLARIKRTKMKRLMNLIGKYTTESDKYCKGKG